MKELLEKLVERGLEMELEEFESLIREYEEPIKELIGKRPDDRK